MSSDETIGIENAMHQHVMALTASQTEHPPVERLELYASGRDESHGEEYEALLEHLASCTDCAALVRFGFGDPGGLTQALPSSVMEAAWHRISGQVWLGMPQWTSLAQTLQRPLGVIEKRINLCSRVAESLATLHGSGRVVSYLSPETILLEPGSGQARMREPDGEIAFWGVSKHRPEAVRFFSPEQINGQFIDGRSNLFSFGSLMYETICGVSPFAGRTARETAGRIISLDARPMVEIRTDVPPEVEQLTQRLLQKDRSKRPASSSAVAAALRAIEEGQVNPLAGLDDRSEILHGEIESLYENLDQLNRRKQLASRAGREEPGLDDDIQAALSQLRGLQKEEADLFRRQFESRLEMPIDAGKQILERARKLKQRFESPTATYRSTG